MNQITLFNSTSIDLQFPGLTGSDGLMLPRVKSKGSKFYTEDSLKEVLTKSEFSEIENFGVIVSTSDIILNENF